MRAAWGVSGHHQGGGAGPGRGEYLSRTHGSGTFVKFRPRVRHSLERNLSYTELISQAGFEVACRLLQVETDKPGAEEAERLRINTSESVLRLERVHSADGRPVIYPPR